MSLRQVIKRDGNRVAYDRDRIESAIFKAASSVGETDRSVAARLAREVEERLVADYGENAIPTVEDIQDIVEDALVGARQARIARAYIIYRNDRARARAARSRTVEATDNIPYKKIYEVLRWNMDHDC